MKAESTADWIVPDDPPPTAKGQRRRGDIIRAAEELFAECRYQDVTVNDITTRADVSVGSYYRYFENKEDLFVLLLGRIFWRMYNVTRGSWDTEVSYLGNLETVTSRYLHEYWNQRLLLRSAHQLAALSESVRAMWHSMRRDLYAHMLVRLQQDQAASQLPPLDPATTMRALGGMVDEYAHRAFVDEEYGPMSATDVDAASKVLASIWFRALFGDRDPQHLQEHKGS